VWLLYIDALAAATAWYGSSKVRNTFHPTMKHLWMNAWPYFPCRLKGRKRIYLYISILPVAIHR
jgi:hypothetical protein